MQNNEESKINNIANNHINNNLKMNNIIKKHNSPYIISKETNYYIRRRMKLKREKIYNKKIGIENKSDLNSFYNIQKIEKMNNNENIINNKNNYYIPGKYYKNEIYFYTNKHF